MKSHRLFAPLALSLVAPLALAQMPEDFVRDPLCDGISGVVKAAGEERPFLSLVPPGQSLGSLPRLNRNPEGLVSFSSCQLYRAGNAKEGVNGGGPYNYVRCIAYSKMTSSEQKAESDTAQAEAKDIYDKLAARVGVCLVTEGWSAAGGERIRKYQDYETVMTFAKEGSPNNVAVEFIEDHPNAGSRSKTTSRMVYLYVRNPNPTHPKQD